MSDTPTQAPKRRMPWGKIVLVISLGFNLLIVGLIVGAKVGDDRRPDGPARVLGLGPYFSALSSSDKFAIGKAARRETGTLRESRRALRQHTEAFIAALRADPFDASAISALLEEQRGHIGGIQMQGQKLLLERIEAMTSDERAEYADRVTDAMKHGRKRR